MIHLFFGERGWAVLLGLSLVACTTSALAQQERILDYHSDIVVAADGSLSVTETIRVTAAGRKIKRGIYRDVPTVYSGPLFIRVEVPFEVKAVQRDGKPEPFHTEKKSNGVRIYIGRESRRLAQGTYTYTIQYRMGRQLGFFKDHDELYWNVTGNDWDFSIDKASATVTLPGRVPPKEMKAEGYTGRKGSKKTDLTASVDEKTGDSQFQTTRPLQRNEGLTIVVQFPKGVIPEPTAAEQRAAFLAANRILLVAGQGLVLVLGYYWIAFVLIGRDPQRGVVIPQFEPPLDMPPACMRYIDKMGYDNKCFTAAVVNMAVKGHVEIEESDGEYTLVRTEGGKQPLSPGEQRIAKHVIRSHRTRLTNAQHKHFEKAIKALKQLLALEYHGKLFYANRKWLIPGLILSFGTILAAALTSPWEQALATGGVLLWLTIWTCVVVALGVAAVSLWRDVFTQGSTVGKAGSLIGAIGATIFFLAFAAGECMGLFFLVQASSIWMVPLVLALIGINFLFFHLLKRPTVAGRQIMDQIDGFRMYLSAAEAKQLAMGHPPDQTPELFEKYLPYALALGVETQWTERFAGVLAQASQDPGNGHYQPTWYHGDSWSSNTMGGFACGLGSSLGSAISSASTAPGSSSGGGGGGSSGGGGGGGGGGGW